MHGSIEKAERALGIDNLYDPRNAQLANHLNQALKAQSLYHRDVDYVIQDGEVKIVDEFTGRIMEGRRWSEGLHQAVEAKEGVRIQEEHVTMATITLQNYFRLYTKLAGMTGTAKTEEKEFVEIYNLNVVEIPTNVDVARDDRNDQIFKTKEAKYAAAIDDIKERNAIGQPVLVGTISVEVSEHLSQLLDRQGIPHNVLNAKQHEQEAGIIEGAGQKGAVTIATNMAGRGVDIKLGEGVLEVGGLYVLGTERHEARRIDNQLRGRSGRQGDPGESRFYLSGLDDLVRLFAGNRIYGIMDKFKVPDDQPMEAGVLSRQIENAQKKVEEQNFVMRKNVLKYDDVLNKQRTVIYGQRQRVLHGEDLSEQVYDWIDEVIERVVAQYTESEHSEEWDLEALCRGMQDLYAPDEPITVEELREEVALEREAMIQEFQEDAHDRYEEKEKALGPNPETEQPLMRDIERFVLLQVVDTRWREHLENMDYLREGVHLRSMAQKDPLVEYTAEGHIMFQELNASIQEEVVMTLFHAEIEVDGGGEDFNQPAPAMSPNGDPSGFLYQHESLAGSDVIARRGSGSDRGRARGGRRIGHDPAARHVGARQDRPQRPVLVRQRQEVQALPRRVEALLRPHRRSCARTRLCSVHKASQRRSPACAPVHEQRFLRVPRRWKASDDERVQDSGLATPAFLAVAFRGHDPQHARVARGWKSEPAGERPHLSPRLRRRNPGACEPTEPRANAWMHALAHAQQTCTRSSRPSVTNVCHSLRACTGAQAGVGRRHRAWAVPSSHGRPDADRSARAAASGDRGPACLGP